MSFFLQPEGSNPSVWTLSSCEEDEDVDGPEPCDEDLFIPLKNEKGYFTITSNAAQDGVGKRNETLELCSSAEEAAKRKRSETVNESKPAKVMRKSSSTNQIEENGVNGYEEEFRNGTVSFKETNKFRGVSSASDSEDSNRSAKNNPAVWHCNANKSNTSGLVQNKSTSPQKPVSKEFKRSSKGGVKCSCCKTRFSTLQVFANHSCNTGKTSESNGTKKGKDHLTQLNPIKVAQQMSTSVEAIPVKLSNEVDIVNPPSVIKISPQNIIGKNKEFNLRSGHIDVTSQYRKYVTNWKTYPDLPEIITIGDHKFVGVPSDKPKRETPVVHEPVLKKKRKVSLSDSEVSVQTKKSPATEEPKKENQLSSVGKDLSLSISAVWEARESSLNEKYGNALPETRRSLVEKRLEKEKKTGLSEWSTKVCPVCLKTLVNHKYVVEHLKTVHKEHVLKDEFLRSVLFGIDGPPTECKETSETSKQIETAMASRTASSRRSTRLFSSDVGSHAQDRQVLPGHAVNVKVEESDCGEMLKHHKCKVCENEFNDIYDLYEHTNEVHPNEEFSDDPSKSSKKSKRHKTHACAVCSQEFEQARILNKHLWLRHKQKENVAAVIKEEDKEKGDNKIAVARYMCFYCNENFSSLSCLIQHKQNKHTQSGSEPLKRMKLSELEASEHKSKVSSVCKSCSRFYRPVILKKHMRMAPENQDLANNGICEICSGNFSDVLRKPLHHCNKCNLDFESVSAFKKHWRNHTRPKQVRHSSKRDNSNVLGIDSSANESLYDCKQCDRSFRNSSSLGSHCSTYHQSGRSLERKSEDDDTGEDEVVGRIRHSSTEERKPKDDKRSRKFLQKREDRGLRRTDQVKQNIAKTQTETAEDSPKRITRKSREILNKSDTNTLEKDGISCYSCSRIFQSRKALSAHVVKTLCGKTNTKQENDSSVPITKNSSDGYNASESTSSYTCSICGKDFSSAYALSGHRSSCKKKERKSFGKEESSNEVSMDEERLPTCTSCNKVFQSGIQLIAHRKGECAHQKKSPVKRRKRYCSGCNKTYMNDTIWEKHLKTNCKEKNMKEADEKKEEDVQINEESNMCKLCQKTYPSVYALKRHETKTLCGKRLSESASKKEIPQDGFLSKKSLLAHEKEQNLEAPANSVAKSIKPLVAASSKSSDKVTSKFQGSKSAKSCVKETAKSSVKKTAKSSVKETAKSSVKETAKSSVKETAKSSVKETAKSPVKETAKSPVKETTKSPVKETSKSPVKETSKSPVKATAKSPVTVSTSTSVAAAATFSGRKDSSVLNSNECSVCEEIFDKSWKLRRHYQISHSLRPSMDSPEAQMQSVNINGNLPSPNASTSRQRDPETSNMMSPVNSRSHMFRSSSGSVEKGARQAASNLSNGFSTSLSYPNRSSTPLHPPVRQSTSLNHPSTSNASSASSSVRFPCSYCSQGFNRQIDLAKHVILSHDSDDFSNAEPSDTTGVSRAHHSETDDVDMVPRSRSEDECHICGQQFPRSSMLQKHVMECHVEKTTNISLSSESSFHPYVTSFSSPQRFRSCMFCNQMFNDDLKMRMHMIEHHPDLSAFTDTFLGSSFDNERRRQRRDDERTKLYKQCVGVALAMQASYGEPVKSVTLTKVTFQSERSTAQMSAEFQGPGRIGF